MISWRMHTATACLSTSQRRTLSRACRWTCSLIIVRRRGHPYTHSSPVPLPQAAALPPHSHSPGFLSLCRYISQLPIKGRLFSIDPTSGAQRQITEAYNPFDVGTGTTWQYLSSVDRVSSFWGGPPYAGCMPMCDSNPRRSGIILFLKLPASNRHRPSAHDHWAA